MPLTKAGRVRVRNTKFFKQLDDCGEKLDQVKAHLLRLDYWQIEMLKLLKQLEKDLQE